MPMPHRLSQGQLNTSCLHMSPHGDPEHDDCARFATCLRWKAPLRDTLLPKQLSPPEWFLGIGTPGPPPPPETVIVRGRLSPFRLKELR